jgi:hypothetical protein
VILKGKKRVPITLACWMPSYPRPHPRFVTVQRSKVLRGWGCPACISTHPLSYYLKMEPEAVDPQAKILELEKQVAALKKDNTKVKNEMRFNLEQEKFVKFIPMRLLTVHGLF